VLEDAATTLDDGDRMRREREFVCVLVELR
jgi:hypothetical protein